MGRSAYNPGIILFVFQIAYIFALPKQGKVVSEPQTNVDNIHFFIIPTNLNSQGTHTLLQNAIDTMSSGVDGGTLFISPRVYFISSPLLIQTSYFNFIGEQNQDHQNPVFMLDNKLNLSNWDSVIQISNSSSLNISNIALKAFYVSSNIGLTIAGSDNIWLFQVQVFGFKKGIVTRKSDNDTRLNTNISLIGCEMYYNEENGIQLDHVKDIIISSSRSGNNGYSCLSCGPKCENVQIHCSVFEQCGWNGIWVHGDTTGIPNNVSIETSVFSENDRDILLDGVKNVTITQNTFIQTNQDHVSIVVVASNHCLISHNTGNTNLVPLIEKSNDIVVQNNTHDDSVINQNIFDNLDCGSGKHVSSGTKIMFASTFAVLLGLLMV